MTEGRPRAIRRDTLQMVLEAARDTHPYEFAGVLRAHEGIITEILLVPGTVQGSRHAILRINELPIDFSIVGVVHSHPSPNPRPSQEDLILFGQYGHTHIIAAYPYGATDWRCWDNAGQRVPLEVLP